MRALGWSRARRPARDHRHHPLAIPPRSRAPHRSSLAPPLLPPPKHLDPENSIATFLLFEVQANAVASAITGRGTFPALAEREQWLLDEEVKFRERGVDPHSRAAHLLAELQWDYMKRLLRLSGAGIVAQGPGGVTAEAVRTRPGVGQVEVKRLMELLVTKEAIFDDASDGRSHFPGGPDDYRLTEYDVDWESGSFSISIADRKANGEAPSAYPKVADGELPSAA